MNKKYHFMATYQQAVDINTNMLIDEPIKIEIRQCEMPDEIGDYYVAFGKAFEKAKSMASIDKGLIGLRYLHTYEYYK